MPRKPARPCKHPHCSNTTLNQSGYCTLHAQPRKPDARASAARRGYGVEWRSIRERVLRAHGIPKELWSHYDVDHRPRYDPRIEPDHNRYELVPMLRSEHSHKTATHDVERDRDGNFHAGGGGESLAGNARDRAVQDRVGKTKTYIMGSQ